MIEEIFVEVKKSISIMQVEEIVRLLKTKFTL